MKKLITAKARKFGLITLVAIGTLLMNSAALADFDPLLYANGDPIQNMNIANNYVSVSALNDATFNSGGNSNSGKPTMFTLAPPITGTAEGPTKLAATLNLPPDQNALLVAAFQVSLDTYKLVERSLNIPENDIAGALAAFLATNYAVYHNSPLLDNAPFLKLVKQMRKVLVKVRAFKRASEQTKRDLYEQMAIIGMFTYLSSQQFQNDPNISAQITQLAKTNLEQFLRVKAQRIRLTQRGLLKVRR